MMRYSLLVAAIFGTAGAASAQFSPYGYGAPGGYGGGGALGAYGGYGGYGGAGFGGGNPNVMPNIYNPQNQPLSPYLNLLRGGNAGVNYYYGVRPGTVGGFGQGALGAPFTAFGGNRPLFFPQLASGPELALPGEVAEGSLLPPAGHPVMFNNTMGYFPSPFGSRGGYRPGLSGMGMTRPQSRK
jgi:hypothetical protein